MARPPEPWIDEVFADRYVIQRLLGQGDRKRTYLAKDTKLDRQVAVSFVKPEAVISDPEGTEREAKVLGRIGSHPNIVSLYDYEISHDGSYYSCCFRSVAALPPSVAGLLGTGGYRLSPPFRPARVSR